MAFLFRKKPPNASPHTPTKAAMSEADLLDAAGKGDVAKVQRCLAAGVSVSCKDGDGATPLHFAAGIGHKEVAALLLGAGAAVDAADKYGCTPLHCAAIKGHKEVAALLLGAGAAVDAANKVDGRTPLHFAAWFGHKEVAALLLGAAAAVDAATKERKTPLYLAAYNGHKEVAALLLDAGAAVDAANKDGKTPADVCCTGDKADKANKGPILAALTAAAAARKAVPKQQQAVAVAPAPPAVKRPPRQPLAVPAVAAALSLCGGGTVTLAASAFKDPAELLSQVALTSSSSLLEDVPRLDSALVAAGVNFAFGVVGSAVTANPLGLIKAVTDLLTTAVGAAEAVMYCKAKAARIRSRLSALVPALQMFHAALLQHAAAAAAQQQQQLHTLNDNLFCLLKVLLELKRLLDSFRRGSSNARRRTWQFLTARGYQQEFNELDGELQACVAQLTSVMHFFQFARQAAEKAGGLEVGKWGDQNDQDWKEDMKQLEGQMLQVVGGMDGLKEMLSSQAAALGGQAAMLQQVVEWMQAMQAPSVKLLDTIQDGFSDVRDQLSEIKRYMKAGRRAGAARPGLLIPRASLHIVEGALRAGATGTYGTVVAAQQDFTTKVAVKLYNHGQLGQRDMGLALREALVLHRLSHANVVRCLGIVDDPHSDPRKSIHGSLVMNWVDGGQLYTWLQDHDDDDDDDGELPFAVRLGVALQVAAGMNHLHICKVMHGDLKPQNVMLQHRPRAVAECPQVVICDFGLAHTNATTAAATTTTQHSSPEAASTHMYTSPERSQPPQSFKPSFQDDVYAFGILMHFIATSETPFQGIHPTHLLGAIREGTRPEGLEAWVQRAAPTERDARQRYMTLAQECWCHSPGKRPGFGNIVVRLRELCREVGLGGR